MSGALGVTRHGVDIQHLLISIRLPDGHWAGDITRENNNVTIRIREHMPLPRGRGSAQGTVSGDGIDACMESLEGHPGIESVTYFAEESDRFEFAVTISKGGGGFLRPLIDAEVVPQTPFDARDGWVEWEFSTDHEHVVNLVRNLKESGLPHRIHSLSKDTSSRLLTVRQREVFDLAVKHGYYESPRRITLTNLAVLAGVSKSTMCELIHLIEKQIIGEFAESVRRQSPKQ
ncbi:MAG: helix-turn-helix domain-containing protein [Candidatus Thalassarchaeaceae archaeon]|nr:helix-turn-helix domain-containing protein [Candidatus Thalassarchaeaceae archaeon]MDP7256818.1 helix-turn-helix domain-containing protein [Candidatus Thalassarchaeaceae archaeon]MDP7446058.1 helix-turn-helix domain-containing protein [Candidatus Thalassarchaeaceae archaeon]MDP7649500.1 helix-turn-helix domain-containing protein [Candidatus Thalassarchaeaceae archaeon]HJL54741.1 helix-turn-helix domain-containing protein [Candidatus Thalassarchaeaceae archaeon]